MSNAYRRLIKLLPQPLLLAGTVVGYEDGVATIEQPGGGISTARGETTVGARVFFRDGVIEGPAPDLPEETIEV